MRDIPDFRQVWNPSTIEISAIALVWYSLFSIFLGAMTLAAICESLLKGYDLWSECIHFKICIMAFSLTQYLHVPTLMYVASDLTMHHNSNYTIFWYWKFFVRIVVSSLPFQVEVQMAWIAITQMCLPTVFVSKRTTDNFWDGYGAKVYMIKKSYGLKESFLFYFLKVMKTFWTTCCHTFKQTVF